MRLPSFDDCFFPMEFNSYCNCYSISYLFHISKTKQFLICCLAPFRMIQVDRFFFYNAHFSKRHADHPPSGGLEFSALKKWYMWKDHLAAIKSVELQRSWGSKKRSGTRDTLRELALEKRFFRCIFATQIFTWCVRYLRLPSIVRNHPTKTVSNPSLWDTLLCQMINSLLPGV